MPLVSSGTVGQVRYLHAGILRDDFKFSPSSTKATRRKGLRAESLLYRRLAIHPTPLIVLIMGDAAAADTKAGLPVVVEFS